MRMTKADIEKCKQGKWKYVLYKKLLYSVAVLLLRSKKLEKHL